MQQKVLKGHWTKTNTFLITFIVLGNHWWIHLFFLESLLLGKTFLSYILHHIIYKYGYYFLMVFSNLDRWDRFKSNQIRILFSLPNYLVLLITNFASLTSNPLLKNTLMYYVCCVLGVRVYLTDRLNVLSSVWKEPSILIWTLQDWQILTHCDFPAVPRIRGGLHCLLSGKAHGSAELSHQWLKPIWKQQMYKNRRQTLNY